MKANEFVKKFGLDRAKQFVNADSTAHALVFATTGVSFIDLKRLVESHELVEAEGGIDEVKHTFNFASKHGADELTEHGKKLKQAIADVESCVGVG